MAALPAILLLGATPDRVEAQAALLFEYRPHPGQEEQFHEGYRRHLEWHRAQRDSLIWYGWQVLTGERLGVFVDGTFGRPFLAIDQRVDPAGDAADFAETTAPYATPLLRLALALHADLSTATPLEDGEPTPMLEVIRYRLRPGTEERFEAVLSRMRAAGEGEPVPYTWYELVDGGRHPTYLQLIHRHGFAGWDSGRADLRSLLASIPDEARRASLASVLAEIVLEVSSEMWRYLPASSLIPER